jgi:hypothetical protein
MIEVLRSRDGQSKQRRLWIAGTAGLLTIVSIALLSSSPAGSNVNLAQVEPAISNSVSKPAEHGQMHAAADAKLAAAAIQAAGSSPKTSGLAAQARTTKLEWQQGWQPNGWQLRDGDWPDEGGTFSEGQTYADDPATFKIHQTYAYVPGNHPMSKAEAEADWTEMQKRYFRQTPSRSTYPAVPVVFDEDAEGGHSHVEPIIHKTDNIYINSEHRPSYFPAHRRFFPAHPRHFKSVLHGQELYQVKSDKVSGNPKLSTYQLGPEYVKSQHQNKKLEQELAEVDKESNLASIVNPAAESTGLSKYVENSPYNFNNDAGETQDWKEVLFMQGALYEMQKKLSDEEDENRKLRNQLAMWKVKDTTPTPNDKQAASNPHTDKSEQHQISELKTIIENIESKQKSTDFENEHLRQQLSAIQKLTFKKAKLESGKSPTTSSLALSSAPTSSGHRSQESSAFHNQISRSKALKVTLGGVAKGSKIRSDGVHSTISPATAPKMVTPDGSVHGARQPAAPMASKTAASPMPKPATPVALVKAAAPAAAATEAKPAVAVAGKQAAAAVKPHASVSPATQAPQAAPAKAKPKSATIVAKAAAASAVAFRQASLATKDAVVRALAADEESSLVSDTDAIFGGGTAVDEEGDVGRDGFDRLHSLERSALQHARR